MRTYFFVFTFFVIGFSPKALAQIKSSNLSYAAYWQQHVDYTMDVDMNVENYQYTGSQKLIYTNNSPETLDKIYYHLYFNAFQPGSEMDNRLQTIVDPDDRMVTNIGTPSKPEYKSKIALLKPNETGFLKIQSLLQDGNPITYKVEGTILEVVLNQPIASGEKTTLDMKFTGQVPLMIRRAGRNNEDGIALSMAQWYPKLCEYDDEGWHTDPYVAREFYGVWGDFDVAIHIDKEYVLAGTGYLQNPQEVGYGYENNELPLNLPKKEKFTWRFKAPNVHDFSWAADPDYAHDILQTKDGITLHFLYKNNKSNQKIWQEMQPYAVKSMEYYNGLLGKYMYDQYSVIQAGDGGMEYGMCTFVNTEKYMMGLWGTVVHEMAHAWFQFALATNESKYAWMDEGFTSYVQTLAMSNILNQKRDFPYQENYEGYFYMVSTGKEEPLTTHADRYETNMSYGISAYLKGSVFLSQLGYVIGQDNLGKTLWEYYRLWSGKHPKPKDFIKIAEQVSGLQLGWYLNEFVETTHTVDYAIQSVKDYEIILERKGNMPMPVELEVTYTDDTKDYFYIPLDLMRGEKTVKATTLEDWNWGTKRYSFKTSKKPKKIIIDPSQYMADIQRENNQWEN